jgi:hypothetical protein
MQTSNGSKSEISQRPAEFLAQEFAPVPLDVARMLLRGTKAM